VVAHSALAVKRTLNWLYQKLWKEPKGIRGAAWTLVFYSYVLLGLAVGSIVCQSPGGFFLLIAFSLVSMLLTRLNRKPGKPERQYSHRRRHAR
jgi:hypothetical protein